MKRMLSKLLHRMMMHKKEGGKRKRGRGLAAPYAGRRRKHHAGRRRGRGISSLY